jgi:hypothetical protein
MEMFQLPIIDPLVEWNVAVAVAVMGECIQVSPDLA